MSCIGASNRWVGAVSWTVPRFTSTENASSGFSAARLLGHWLLNLS